VRDRQDGGKHEARVDNCRKTTSRPGEEETGRETKDRARETA